MKQHFSLLARFALFISVTSLHAGTHVWTGAGPNRYWNTPANWTGGAPSANETAPVILEFPASFTGTFTNNIPSLKVDQIRLLGSGQALRGSGGVSLTLRGGVLATNLHNAGINYLEESLSLLLDGTNHIVAPLGLSIYSAIGGSGGFTVQGTVRLDGAQPNTFNGAVVLQEGNLILDKAAGPTGLVSVPGPLVLREGRVKLVTGNNIADASVVTVETGATLDLNGQDDTIASLTLNGGSVETDAGVLTLAGAVRAQGFGGSISGKLSLGNTTRTFEVGPMASLTVNAVVSNGGGLSHPGIAKTGTGTLRLLGANTFTGSVQVYDGIVEVGNASALGSSFPFGTTVAAGATLRVLGGITVPAEPLTLNGGALYGQGFVTWGGPITLATNSHLRAVGVTDELRLIGAIDGPGGFTHAGLGRLYLGGTNANTFAGAVHITEGDLWLSKLNHETAIPGPLIVGNPSNTNNENTVWIDRAHQLADLAPVTLLSSAVLWLNNVNETIGPLVLDGAEMNTGTGTLTLNGDLTSQPSTELSRITGRMNLGGALRTFDVQSSTLVPALWVTASVSGTGASGLRKTGGGHLWLSGDNSYAGETIVVGGELFIDHPNALGEANGLAATGTRVESGATLNAVLPASTVMEGLVLSGDGVATNGAWILQGGNQTWGGRVHFMDTARLRVNDGTALILTNLVTGPGAFRKVGKGILTFAGQTINTFQSRAIVHEGRVHCGKPHGFTSLSGGLEIDGLNNGSAPIVRLYADQQINDEAAFVSLSHGGILDLNGYTEDIRYLLGSGFTSEIRLGSGELRVFKGSYSGVISGTGRLRKISADRLALFGDNTYTGDTSVDEGTLSVYRTLASANVLCQPSTELSGDGALKNAVLNHANLKPGLFTAFDLAAINFENLTLTNAAAFTAEIRGVVPGVGYDQLRVNGTVRLNSAALDLKLGHPGTANTAYVLISNAGNDPVLGTFAGKPEGATFNVAGAQFQITYQGGDGNDVVALQLTPATNDFTVRLDIAPVPGTNQVLVSWPTFASDHRLHRCTDPHSNTWNQVFGTLLISEDKFYQTFPTTNQSLLFRLEKLQN